MAAYCRDCTEKILGVAAERVSTALVLALADETGGPLRRLRLGRVRSERAEDQGDTSGVRHWPKPPQAAEQPVDHAAARPDADGIPLIRFGPEAPAGLAPPLTELSIGSTPLSTRNSPETVDTTGAG